MTHEEHSGYRKQTDADIQPKEWELEPGKFELAYTMTGSARYLGIHVRYPPEGPTTQSSKKEICLQSGSREISPQEGWYVDEMISPTGLSRQVIL